MPKIIKFYEQGDLIKSFDYSSDFAEEKKACEAEEDEEQTNEQSDTENDGTDQPKHKKKEKTQDEVFLEETKQKADDILKNAQEEAEEIIRQAKEEAELLKQKASEEGHQEGFQIGHEKGVADGLLAYDEKMEAEGRAFMEELSEIIKETEIQKNEILMKYRSDLKDIAIAVGEKVIHISLKSSGEVIEKMIVSAVEKLKTKEWAKIYIAKCDADLLVQGDYDILRAVSHLSKHLKVVAMENESPGTCIVELPDEIIDASANTQVENIKGISNNVGL